MTIFNINLKLIESIQNLYSKAESAVYLDGKVGEWFQTTTGVRKGCLLSSTLSLSHLHIYFTSRAYGMEIRRHKNTNND